MAVASDGLNQAIGKGAHSMKLLKKVFEQENRVKVSGGRPFGCTEGAESI